MLFFFCCRLCRGWMTQSLHYFALTKIKNIRIPAVFLTETLCPPSGRGHVFPQLPLRREAFTAGRDEDRPAATGRELKIVIINVQWSGIQDAFFTQNGLNLLIKLSPGGCVWPTQGSWCLSENCVFVQGGTRDQDSCPRNYRWINRCCYWGKEVVLLTDLTLFVQNPITDMRVTAAVSFKCPLSLCPTVDAMLNKLLSASALQSYCFLSTLLVMIGLLKVQHCSIPPKP